MKSELKVFGAVALVSISLVGLFTVINNKKTGYYMTNDNNSIANYIVIDENSGNDNESAVADEPTEVEELEFESIDEESDQQINDEIVETNIVYDNMTLDELAEKINRSLNSTISGKGYLIASHALEMGVDPYMATAIILQETGCKWECSYLVKSCNNVGGQKGSGCGSYSYFDSIDNGIIAFIDNLYRNYISYGLTTPDTINPKYAEDPNWSVAVNKYIETIKAQ